MWPLPKDNMKISEVFHILKKIKNTFWNLRTKSTYMNLAKGSDTGRKDLPRILWVYVYYHEIAQILVAIVAYREFFCPATEVMPRIHSPIQI